MNKKMKSVSMLLLLGSLSTGMTYAASPEDKTEFDITQQTATCQGIVKDITGEAIIGASVIVKGTTNGSITDIDGNFSLPNIPKGSIIEISFVGYISQSIKWNGENLNIILKEDNQTLDEVVVIGYGGSQLRSKMTNSVAKVDNSIFEAGSHTNPAQALSGAVAGLRVQQNSGNPTSAPTLVLRGGTNLDGSGSPLIIVDGAIRESLNDINSADIESMEVMKDAGATAIYGARAANGVILITTKKGTKDEQKSV